MPLKELKEKVKNFFRKVRTSFISLPVSAKRLLGLGMTLALVVALPLFVWGITTQKFDVRKRAASGEPTITPIPTTPYFENEYLRVWDSRVFPGIIDLFYKNSAGVWEQYNNIVPIARVGSVWANAELDKAVITREVIQNDLNKKVVKYQFTKLNNGAHFYLLMTLKNGKREVQFKAILNSDSVPVSAFSLGNYYGYAQLVRYIKVNNTLYDSLSYPRPNPDGNYIQGTFIRLERPTNRIVSFWGEKGIIQKQTVDIPLSGQDEVVAEIRYTPWLPSQIPPGKNWFETVHITRSPFTDEKSVWRFSFDPLPTPSRTAIPTPTPTVRPTATPTRTPPPTPTRTPTPTARPTPKPSIKPSPTPSYRPTPTVRPTILRPTPTRTPTPRPTPTPTAKPPVCRFYFFRRCWLWY